MYKIPLIACAILTGCVTEVSYTINQDEYEDIPDASPAKRDIPQSLGDHSRGEYQGYKRPVSDEPGWWDHK